ncbi:hypothetical protein SNK03_009097 [Fusarium graminearum]|uniref:Chromosome 4, complete genome n=1 Tax=Gibberella zeae (strain ATCC MYA-4620 / CBS 123657 / FGSC 9075 / NRRL 31084 / PH-1) TaxID=229533 RepID=I1S8K2_GIBZE|nr:hypothetical protein FGSG_13180 [Fusarium graminearum PH-1]ESU13951.1 hypothetical protein FGSG_13180 [Fusarium graminearum PH-1]CEF84187.1 unnamed protein product [Fusarium graminearum]CZS73583.1 unnamed protein product [Fusarium graminearum]|eukprot:XP_011327458.1 hypothetical protein FGSG_13180 [Fusarium graminearum PH-1]
MSAVHGEASVNKQRRGEEEGSYVPFVPRKTGQDDALAPVLAKRLFCMPRLGQDWPRQMRTSGEKSGVKRFSEKFIRDWVMRATARTVRAMSQNLGETLRL